MPAGRTHYAALGVRPDASAQEIRAAYRDLAREHHPDRAGSAASSAARMAEINAAYRVLSDPGRRAVYDAGLREPTVSARSASSTTSYEATIDTAYRYDGPARVPWRSLLFVGVIAVAAIVILAQFTDPGEPAGPDGILRNGDCVEIEPDLDAREIACAGESGELVVRAFVPFEGTCPNDTVAHRDRQGMGVACVAPRP